MASHEAPVRARRPTHSADARADWGTQPPIQTGRCPGAAAQLATVHRTLRHGPILRSQPGDKVCARDVDAQPAPLNRRSASAVAPSPGGSGSIAQLRRIPDPATLHAGLVQELNAGENAGGSNRKLLSAQTSNVKKLSHLYTPSDRGNEGVQKRVLARTVDNAWREGWYDRIDARVRQGAQDTTGDILFWAGDIRQILDAIEVDPTAVELLGDELHDRGLGPAKVDFVIEFNHNPLVAVSRTYVVKPEDRSVEKAILGSGDSVASRLNTRVATGRQVNTLDIETHPAHGTIMEYVTSSLKTFGEWALRKVRFWDSTSAVTTETIALGLLTGLYDLHGQNVMGRGGAPALIDADVAARPRELQQGPSQQQGFGATETQSVQGQIGGDRSGASQILQYAINNPDAVTRMITSMIGNHRSRIVPVFTGLLADMLLTFVEASHENSAAEANAAVERATNAVADGDGPSPGLTQELGPDLGHAWNPPFVRGAIRADFNSGVIPHFQYQSATGEVFLHNQVIWKGTTLAQSMAALAQRLQQAQ